MSDHFNDLTPAQAERLALLAEEIGETQQVIGKILRHGYESVNPFNPTDTNRQLLVREIGDILVAIDFLVDYGDITQADLEDRRRVKHHRVWDWLHHQDPRKKA